MTEQRDLIERVQGAARQLDAMSAPRCFREPGYVLPTAAAPSRRRPLLVGAAMVCAIAVVVAVAIVKTGDDQPVAVASGGPARLLLEAPGWKIVRHDEQPESGSVHYETDFASGAQQVALHQRPNGYNDKFAGNNPSVDVLGNRGELVANGPEFRAFWRVGKWDFELRGNVGDEAQFRALLAALRYVDEATWDVALPDTVIKSSDRAAVVEGMLRDVPRPPAFDAAALETSVRTNDRYQLGAQVASAVLCGWIQVWIDAKQHGDAATAQTAVAALDTSRTWPFLNDMLVQGDYPRVVWQYVDAIDSNGTVTGGKVLPVEDSYRDALGCR